MSNFIELSNGLLINLDHVSHVTQIGDGNALVTLADFEEHLGVDDATALVAACLGRNVGKPAVCGEQDEPSARNVAARATDLKEVFDRLDVIGLDQGHPTHQVAADAIRKKMDGLTDRDLVELLDAGVSKITEALGFAPGGADFDVMVGEITRLRSNQRQPSRSKAGPTDGLDRDLAKVLAEQAAHDLDGRQASKSVREAVALLVELVHGRAVLR